MGRSHGNWFAADLTGNKHEGLGRWSVTDIIQYLKTGRSARGRVTGTMAEVVRNSTSRMTDKDRLAIANYLKSLPASHPATAEHRPDLKAMEEGEAIYVQTCSLVTSRMVRSLRSRRASAAIRSS